MYLWLSYKKKIWYFLFIKSLKSLKELVGSGVGSGSWSISQRYGSGSEPRCHGSPTLRERKKNPKTADGSTDLHMLVEWLGGCAQGSGSFKVPLGVGKLGRWHLNKTKQAKGWDMQVLAMLWTGLRVRFRIRSGFNRVCKSGSGSVFGIRIQEGKMSHKSRKN